jgi:hypothetical protein
MINMICDVCGRETIPCRFPDEVWIRLFGKEQGAAHVCPTCFVGETSKLGYSDWVVTPRLLCGEILEPRSATLNDTIATLNAFKRTPEKRNLMGVHIYMLMRAALNSDEYNEEGEDRDELLEVMDEIWFSLSDADRQIVGRETANTPIDCTDHESRGGAEEGGG